MPMTDVDATTGTFPGKHRLAVDFATAVMTIEQVPDIPMFRQNTAAVIHDLPPQPVQRRRRQQHRRRGRRRPALPSRTWVLLTEAPTATASSSPPPSPPWR